MHLTSAAKSHLNKYNEIQLKVAELLELLSLKRDCNKIKDLSNNDGKDDHDQRKSHSAEQVPD